MERKLAAILAADVVGYSRLMGDDEAGTISALKALRKDFIEPLIAGHRGRVVKLMGDGFLVEFQSVVDAVECAIGWQSRSDERAGGISLQFRIGINSGDIVIDEGDIYGDGVNVAARLEGLAEPGGIALSQIVHDQVAGKVEAAFEDTGEHNLKNIAKPVRVYRVRLGDETVDVADGPPTPSLSGKPAIAVLPFDNMSGDPDQEYFVDGITEDIITALSLWRSFPVIARNSTFAYKGKSPDIRDVGKALGARYVVEGSVRKAGSRVRVTAQLINAETGHHVWAERYDRQLDDIFALQDEMALRIGAIIEPAIANDEVRRLATKPPGNLSAWDLCIQGYALIYDGTKESNQHAREKFEKAIELDPNYARAFTGLAYTHRHDIRMRYSASREEAVEKLFEAARRAVALDNTDSEAHAMLSGAYFNAGHRENGIAESRRAVELNPHSSGANMLLGGQLYFVGRWKEGIPWLEKALEINPLDPRNHINKTHLAAANMCSGNYERALELARDATRQRADYIDSHVTLAATLGYLGKVDEAREVIGEFRDKAKDFVEGHPLYGEETKDCFREGLQKAHLID